MRALATRDRIDDFLKALANAAVPFADASYYSGRSTIAIPRPDSGLPATQRVNALDNFFGFAPAFTFMQAFPGRAASEITVAAATVVLGSEALGADTAPPPHANAQSTTMHAIATEGASMPRHRVEFGYNPPTGNRLIERIDPRTFLGDLTNSLDRASQWADSFWIFTKSS